MSAVILVFPDLCTYPCSNADVALGETISTVAVDEAGAIAKLVFFGSIATPDYGDDLKRLDRLQAATDAMVRLRPNELDDFVMLFPVAGGRMSCSFIDAVPTLRAFVFERVETSGGPPTLDAAS